VKRFQKLSRNVQLAVVGGGFVVLLLLPVMVFAVDEIRANGEVARNVQAAGVDLGGLGQDDALAALRAYEAELASTPLDFRIGSMSFPVLPSELSLEIDEAAVVDEAMAQRRDRGFFGRFGDWFSSFGDMKELPVPVTIDPDALDERIDVWEQEAINNPAHEGGVLIRNGVAEPDYPRAGEGVDQPAAQRATLAAVQNLTRRPVTLATRQLQPTLTDEDIDGAVTRANRIIDSAITLRAIDPEVEIEFPAATLAAALIVDVHADAPTPGIDLSFTRGPINRVLAPLRATIEQPARDAVFEIDEEDVVTLVPSRAETLLDVDLVVSRLFDVADRGGATGSFPFAQGVEAEFTTEMAEAMGEITKVSEATTEHSCCEARVTNIQTMADAVDGALVWPGEEFSLNEHVGQRTRTKGYVPAPMILRGEIVDDVGGGVSQFATTMYNAVFFGCYEDVTHTPHSLYFSRYPEGREATVSWGGPELIFKNDTEALLIIKTAYTSRSITVKMFGNTGGRTCTAGLGDRYRYTDPPIEYVGDPTVPPGTEAEDSAGTRGWTIDIFRYIEYDDGTNETEVWSHRYKPRPNKINVNPCDLEDAPTPCTVLIPDVVGRNRGRGVSILEEWSFVASVEEVEVDDEAEHNKVIAQSPAPGLPHDFGATVVIQVGVFVDPGDGEAPPDTP
jgi:vancomycin resistance protein YoaR